jgi:hypothetical protein
VDESTETCNVKGCGAPAAIAVNSSAAGTEHMAGGLGIPALTYA